MAAQEWNKVMYEIYQGEGYNSRFRVVYFTELNDHNRDAEIDRALAGRHVHDGFVIERIISDFVGRLNESDGVGASDLDEALGEFAA